MNDRQRLEAIVSVVCKYLPPDGINMKQAMNEIISLVDPLPPHDSSKEPVAWKPIETAPKDGLMILVCLPRQMNLVVRVRYNRIHNYWQTDYEGEGGITRPMYFHEGDLWHPIPPLNTAHGIKE